MVFNQAEKKLQWYVGNVHKEDTISLKGPVFLAPDAPIPKSSIIANVRFVQPGTNLSGLNVNKIQALRTKGEYNLSSNVYKELQSGNYDVQL